MNIALIGYGTMGRAIESIALQHGHSINARFTSSTPVSETRLTSLHKEGLDCCIDFSHSSAVRSTIEIVTACGIPIIVGTTGWYEQKRDIALLVERNNGTMVYGSNFSVGAQMFFRIVERAAQLMNAFDQYDVAINEMHHTRKKDAPSGTALSLADILVTNIQRKRTVLQQNGHSPLQPHELNIASSRVGTLAGRHSVIFTSPSDEIELIHRAHDRTGFVRGALLAASLIHSVSGVCSFDELIFDRSPHHSYV